MISAPPLKSWVQIAVLSWLMILGLGTFFSDDLMRGKTSAFMKLNERRIQDFAQENGRSGTILIGNSSFKTAFYDWTESMEAPVPALRIVDDHAFFDNFKALIPAILEARPGSVVIQADLLRLQPNWRTAVSRFRISQTSRFTGDDDVHFIQFGPVCPPGLENRNVSEQAERIVRLQLEEHTDWLNSMTVLDSTASVPVQARHTALKFAEEGIDVVILDIPRAPELQALQDGLAAEANAVITKLASESTEIHYWVMPSIPADNFCDIRHFNEAGRARVEAWLMKRLAVLHSASSMRSSE
jgi:hypothetical protein